MCEKNVNSSRKNRTITLKFAPYKCDKKTTRTSERETKIQIQIEDTDRKYVVSYTAAADTLTDTVTDTDTDSSAR